MGGSNLHLAWSQLLARAVASAGVRHAVISPGSRSTPLVLGLCRERALELHSVIDERSAGFYALGIARQTGLPALVVCTSGTAAAHYLPAVMEASLARVPLVVLTADRPWDAYDCAAPQTVDQVKLYGSYVRHYAELGLPDAEAFDAVARVGVQSVLRARGPDAGPVHINARFRKPLEPQKVERPEPWQPAFDRALSRVATVLSAPTSYASAAIDGAARALVSEPAVMIACGPSLGVRADRERVLRAAASSAIPVLAEATSGLRFLPDGEATVLRSIDALCASARWKSEGPAVVIEVGAPMVSTAYARWASDPMCRARRVVFARDGYNDASSTATHVVDADPYAWIEALAREAAPSSTLRAARESWARSWSAADERARAVVHAELAGDALTEGASIAAVRRALEPGSTLIVGNSSCVRDIDAYVHESTPAVRVLHQRGASGIDGLVAGAVGVRAVSDRPVTLLLGDVSLWHDVGSLQLAQQSRGPLAIVVLQNRGGRIFDRLPLGSNAELAREYAAYFLTDRAQSFESVSRAFSLGYERVEHARALTAALERAQRSSGATVIECECVDGNAARFAAVVRAGVAAVDRG